MLTSKQPRRVTIEFGETAHPKFDFEGAWSGHDIGVVLRHIRREYLLHQRALRRQEAMEADNQVTSGGKK